jgi:hypothetical protein
MLLVIEDIISEFAIIIGFIVFVFISFDLSIFTERMLLDGISIFVLCMKESDISKKAQFPSTTILLFIIIVPLFILIL